MTRSSRERSVARVGLVAAVGFLLLDSVLLLLAGAWTGRLALIVWGVVFAVGAAGMPFLWRRYLIRLRELDDARRAMRREVERLRVTLRNGHE